eukprot:g70595.t1
MIWKHMEMSKRHAESLTSDARSAGILTTPSCFFFACYKLEKCLKYYQNFPDIVPDHRWKSKSSSMPKTIAKSLQGVCIDRRGKYYLLVNGQADPVLKDKVTIPPHVFSKYDLGEGMLAALVRGMKYSYSKQGVLDLFKAEKWDDKLGEIELRFTAVDTNAKPVKFQDGPIIKYADDAGQFKEAVVLQGVQLVASGLELGPTRLVYTSDGETAGGMGLAIHLANGWRKKKKGARARTAGKDVLAVRNIWQGDDKPEKKELQFLDIYKSSNLCSCRTWAMERALLWNLEQKRTAKVKHESLNEQAIQSKQVVVVPETPAKKKGKKTSGKPPASEEKKKTKTKKTSKRRGDRQVSDSKPSEYASATDGCRCIKDAH